MRVLDLDTLCSSIGLRGLGYFDGAGDLYAEPAPLWSIVQPHPFVNEDVLSRVMLLLEMTRFTGLAGPADVERLALRRRQ